MNNTDEELAKIQEEINELEAQGVKLPDSSYGSPEAEKKDSIYKFFREIINFKDSWKVGNLQKDEMGRLRLSVRSYLDLANYNDKEGQDIVSDYFTKKADIIAATSMGRDGFIVKTIVTSIKKDEKPRDTPVKHSLFGGGKKDESAAQ